MLDTTYMEPTKTPEPKKHTYQITYGIAIIILTLVLNDMALFLITGRSLFPITYSTPAPAPMYAPQDNMMPHPPVKEMATSTSSSTPKKK
jgi:hypothetical protein